MLREVPDGAEKRFINHLPEREFNQALIIMSVMVDEELSLWGRI
jgi:hypothetical protein